MESPIKLISTDFDGTMHAENSATPVPLHLQEMIASLQQQGVKWVVNTGRDLPGLLYMMERARLSVKPDFLVVVEREIHTLNGHGYKAWDEWNRLCMKQQDELFARIRPRLPELVKWVHDHFDATIYQDEYSPFCLVAASNPDASLILDKLLEFFGDIPELTVVRNDIYARLSHARYNKGTSLGAVARHLNLESAQVLAAGDHYNDLPMLSREVAHWLIAPGNAIPEVKAAVKQQGGYVSTQACGQGLAEGLEYWLKRS